MHKSEFLNKVHELDAEKGSYICQNDYSIIEYVYTWHPAIDAIKGKEQIAYLYVNFGMRLIKDMVDTATKMEKAENKLMKAKTEYENARMAYESLKSGNDCSYLT